MRFGTVVSVDSDGVTAIILFEDINQQVVSNMLADVEVENNDTVFCLYDPAMSLCVIVGKVKG